MYVENIFFFHLYLLHFLLSVLVLTWWCGFWQLWKYGKGTTIRNSEHMRDPASSIFDLIANNVLLKLTNNMAVTCNSRVEQVRLLDDVHNDDVHGRLERIQLRGFTTVKASIIHVNIYLFHLPWNFYLRLVIIFIKKTYYRVLSETWVMNPFAIPKPNILRNV
jgi:hypothetical protein